MTALTLESYAKELQLERANLLRAKSFVVSASVKIDAVALNPLLVESFRELSREYDAKLARVNSALDAYKAIRKANPL